MKMKNIEISGFRDRIEVGEGHNVHVALPLSLFSSVHPLLSLKSAVGHQKPTTDFLFLFSAL